MFENYGAPHRYYICRWRRGLLGLGLATMMVPQPAFGEDTPKDFRLYSIAQGGTIAISNPADEATVSEPTVYYGDGKQFSKLRVTGYGKTESERTLFFWAPNVVSHPTHGGLLHILDGDAGSRLQCGDHESKLETITEKQARTILDSAEFGDIAWQRQVAYVARDDQARYYLVDSSANPYVNDWRLFVGAPGSMRETPLTEVVNDASGTVFATGQGDLTFEGEGNHQVASWTQRGHTKSLTPIPVQRNSFLIHRQLGVYQNGFGTPCDTVEPRAELCTGQWQRTGLVLGQSTLGTYYYVDALVQAQNERLADLQLHVGQKGQWEKLDIQRHAVDSEGMVLLTATGTITIAGHPNAPGFKMTWRHGNQHDALTKLPIQEHGDLVQEILGDEPVLPVACNTQ